MPQGTDEEKMKVYREVRDQIALEIPKLLQEFSGSGRDM